MPETFRAADRGSTSAQARFLRSMRIQLIALGAAAVLGSYSWRWPATDTDWAAAAAALAFALAGVLRASMQRNRLERSWYDGRAVAESAKTMAWCYAVAGRPFPRALDEAAADREFVHRLRELPVGLSDLSIVPSEEAGPQITAGMRSLRSFPLEERKAAYLAGRVRDQQKWYAHNARWNKQRADRWNVLLLSVEACGALAAALKATTEIAIDLLPAVAAIVAGATAYLQTKQHDALASAYSVASLELATVAELLPGVADEEQWAEFVDQAESSVSREHTMWRAKRSPPHRNGNQPMLP